MKKLPDGSYALNLVAELVRDRSRRVGVATARAVCRGSAGVSCRITKPCPRVLVVIQLDLPSPLRSCGAAPGPGRACGRELPYEIKPRRAGDIAENYAACDKARDELGWVAEFDLDRMCADSWRWQSTNPDGYAS